MPSRENRALLVSTLLFLLLVVAAGASGVAEYNALLVILLFGGIGIFAPQLYLTRTDSDIPARTRIRVATLLTMLFTMGIYGSAPDDQRQLVGGLLGLLLVGLIGYEVVGGYQEAVAPGKQEP